MAVSEMGKLEVVDVRKVWENEEQDFTPWLASNLTLLGDALELGLELVQVEAQVGPFSLDILARDDSGTMVAIENQLGHTDHTHLGQLLTYAAGFDVRSLIWVTPHFRDLHRAALDWLNRWTPKEISVYGVEVRAVSIGNSLPAPEFIPVVVPNEWSKSNRDRLNPDSARRRMFYQALVNRLQEVGFTDRKNANSGWIQRFPSGVADLEYCADVGNNPRVIMTIPNRERRKQVFDALRDDSEQVNHIEEALGLESDPKTELVWKTGPGNIVVRRSGSTDNLTSDIEGWMFDHLTKFKEVFNPVVADIVNSLDSDS